NGDTNGPEIGLEHADLIARGNTPIFAFPSGRHDLVLKTHSAVGAEEIGTVAHTGTAAANRHAARENKDTVLCSEVRKYRDEIGQQRLHRVRFPLEALLLATRERRNRQGTRGMAIRRTPVRLFAAIADKSDLHAEKFRKDEKLGPIIGGICDPAIEFRSEFVH